MINGVPRILVIRLSSIGDVARVLPALHTLRKAYPNAQIDWAIEPKALDVISGHPALDQVLVFDRPSGLLKGTGSFWAFCQDVRSGRYELVVDFHGILKSGLISGFSGAPDRYGFARPRGREGSSLFANHRVRLPSQTLNRVEENLLLCDAIAPGHQTFETTIHVSPEVQEEVDTFFDVTFEAGKLVAAIHVPMPRGEKRWPAEHFAKLADLLLADGRFDVLLTWGPGQFREVEEVLRKSRRKPVPAPETTDLKHYAWLVHRAAVYVGGDTGPMHIAAAMGTPVVALFGGTDPARHAPYKKTREVLYIPPGQGQPASPTERLRRITPDMAYDACVRLVFAQSMKSQEGETD